MRRGYVDSRWGQSHYRRHGAGENPALVCLHATAYSGQVFEPFMAHVARERCVLALDTPGYGESDGPPAAVEFAEYADAMADSIRRMVPGGRVDLLGYHTGASLACGIAAMHPALVRRMVLIGVPFFEGADHAAWRERLVHPTALSEDFEQFRDRWAYFIQGRTPGLPLARAFACFVDELKAYPREWWAHHSLFDHDARDWLGRVDAPVLIINPASALAAASRHAARVLPDARVLEMPELGGAIFDLGAARLAGAVNAFLSEPVGVAA